MWPISLHNHYNFLMNPSNEIFFKMELESTCSSEYLDNQHNSPPKRIEKKIFVFGPPGSGKSIFVQKLVSDIYYRQPKLQRSSASSAENARLSSSIDAYDGSNECRHVTGSSGGYNEIHSDEDNDTFPNNIVDSDSVHEVLTSVPASGSSGVLEYTANDDIKIGIKIGIKVLDMTHEAINVMEVWDIPSQCSHSMFMNTFLSKADALVFVFDASESSMNDSFNKTKAIFENLNESASSTPTQSVTPMAVARSHAFKDKPVYLVATKIDLLYHKVATFSSPKQTLSEETVNTIHSINATVIDDRRRVLTSAREWADSRGVTYLEVSSTQNKGVIEARRLFTASS